MSSSCDQPQESGACNQTATHKGSDDQCCNLHEKLLCLADEAWKEVLKDKIKKEIEKSAGAKLDALAQIVAGANHQKWTHMIEGKQKCDEYKNQIKEAFLSLSK
ncbi:MAG TPA: hypothetical protein PKZ32_13810 [Candidatus Melainabacteria bacterium]|nr:hypothetical protein [Candidatus Melainabacteria bacterium]